MEAKELFGIGRKATFALLFVFIVIINRATSLNMSVAELALIGTILGVAYPTLNAVTKSSEGGK